MTDAPGAAGHRINTQRIDQIITLCDAGKRLDQNGALIQPAAADVEHQRHDCVKLVLGICKGVLIDEAVDIGLIIDHLGTEGCIPLLLGHRSDLVDFRLFIGTAGAVADGIAAIRIHIGRPGEALKFLDEGDTFFTCLHFRCCPTGHGQNTQQPDQQCHNQT